MDDHLRDLPHATYARPSDSTVHPLLLSSALPASLRICFTSVVPDYATHSTLSSSAPSARTVIQSATSRDPIVLRIWANRDWFPTELWLCIG